MASAIDAEVKALPQRNTQALRAIRRRYSRALRDASPQLVFDLAADLIRGKAYRWIAYELISNHKPAFAELNQQRLEKLGQGMNSWWTVDEFARILSGPAWRHGYVSDRAIVKWARSADPWWRRASLVSTVALNVRSQGGMGDSARTLRVCDLLIKDKDDAVTKALSWALRALSTHDAKAVREFVRRNDQFLAARVKREVNNKLRTGFKNPGPPPRQKLGATPVARL